MGWGALRPWRFTAYHWSQLAPAQVGTGVWKASDASWTKCLGLGLFSQALKLSHSALQACIPSLQLELWPIFSKQNGMWAYIGTLIPSEGPSGASYICHAPPTYIVLAEWIQINISWVPSRVQVRRPCRDVDVGRIIQALENPTLSTVEEMG